MKLHTKILLGLVAGTVIGIVAKLPGVEWLQTVLISLEPLGISFIRLITMVVVPMVIASLLVATASLGDIRKLAGIGGKTLTYFLVTTVIAATIGLTLALAVQPGTGMEPATRDALAAQFQEETSARTPSEATPSLVQRLVEMIPRNPINAAASMNLLPLVISVLIFGAAVGVIREERRQLIITFFEAINEMVMVVIQWIMKLAPYAVFILIAATIARFGLDLIQRLILYSLVVVAGFALHGLGILSLALRLLARTKIIPFYRAVAETCLVAFSTSSSNAALPVSMKVVVENLKISKRVSSFVLPLGATLNMNGSALYKAVTGVFVAQVYSISLGTDDYVTIIITSTLAAVAGVGIPGSSLVTTLFVLNALGLGPHAATGIALVAGVDRFLDMIRTTVNVTGDLTCAAYIAKSEGEHIAGDSTS